MHDQLIQSFEVKAHNKAAGFFNAGKYEEARKVLEDALDKLPSSKKIKADLDKILKAMQK